MTQLSCWDCIHCDRCSNIEAGVSHHCADVSKCRHFKNKADFVPKSEVVREIFEEIYKTMNSVYASVQHSMVGMHGDNPETMRLLGKLEGIKYLGDEITELKKEYTEGNNV